LILLFKPSTKPLLSRLTLPSRDLSFPLPLGAEITGVSVQLSGVTSLGTLDIPVYIPGVALYPNGKDAAWLETPDEMGVIPTEPYTYEVEDVGSHRVVHTHVMPVTYDARLTLWQDGAAVAQADDVVQVVAVQITDFDGPNSILPGETAVFTVTFANYTTSTLEAGFALELTTEGRQPVATLTPQTQTVPAGGQVTVSFAWDSAAALPGDYQATALVTPAGYNPRSLSRLLQVRRVVYLPLVLWITAPS
jgi:hypothetical protein